MLTADRPAEPDRSAAEGDRGAPPPHHPHGRRRRSFAVLGLLPFFAFVALFLLLPAITVFRDAAKTSTGGTSFSAYKEALTGQYRSSFAYSIKLSVITAVLGAIFGTTLAYAVIALGRPKWLRGVVTAYSGVAANLGGIPLAFAFISALGAQGLVTKILTNFGVNLNFSSFKIYSFAGLVIVYLYFQIPLMLLVMAPAIDGLQVQWREAAENLGASGWQYWRRVGLPLLAPSALGGTLLLFANAFSAYATAYALSTGVSKVVPVQIRFFLQGNTITGKGQLGFALAAWMIIFTSAAIIGNYILQRKTARWLR